MTPPLIKVTYQKCDNIMNTDPSPINPPTPPKKPVDFIAIIIFFLLLGTWLGAGTFAHCMGNLNNLLLPKDTFGRSCGVDSLVENKPFLQYFDVTHCADPGIPFGGCDSKRACVQECPSKVFLASKMENGSQIICLRGPEYWNSSEDCAQWYLPSQAYKGRCVPTGIPNNATLLEISKLENRKVDAASIKKAIKNIKIISEVSHGTQLFMSEILKNCWIILLVALIILLVGLGCLCLFKHFIKLVFIFSLIVVPCITVFFLQYAYRKFFHYENIHSDNQEITNIKKWAWLSTAILTSVAALFLFFMTCFWIAETFKGVQLIKVCNGKMKYATLMVLVSWTKQLLFFVFFLSTFIHLGNIYDEAVYNVTIDDACKNKLHSVDLKKFACDPEYAALRQAFDCKEVLCDIIPIKPRQYLFFQFFNVAMYIATTFMILSLQQMVIALNPRTYKSVFLNLLIIYRCHIGTAFIGAIFIALYKYFGLKLVLIWTARMGKSSKALGRLNCCLGYWGLIEKIYNVVDTAVLTISVKLNKSFLKSSRVYRRISSSGSLSKVKSFGSIYYILFYQKLLICLLCTGSCYLFVHYFKSYSPMAYKFLVVLFTLYFSYVSSSLIFGVYTMKLDACLVDTLIKINQGDDELQNVPSSSTLPTDLLLNE